MDRIRHMSTPVFLPGKKGVRVSVSPARQTAGAIKTPASPKKSITDAVRDESPPFSGKSDNAAVNTHSLPEPQSHPSPRHSGHLPELTKRLLKDRSSGGMDGQNNRSLDFFEADSSDEDQNIQSHDISPRSIATQDKSPSSSVNSPLQNGTQLHESTNTTLRDTFDFGLQSATAKGSEDVEKSRVEALASLDPRIQQDEAMLSPLPSTARSIYGGDRSYQEMFEPFEHPRLLFDEPSGGLQPGLNVHDDGQQTQGRDQTEQSRRDQEGHKVFERLLMLHSVTADKIVDLGGKKSKRHKSHLTPGSPKRPKSAGATPSSSPFRHATGSQWDAPPLPKPLGLNKDQSLLSREDSPNSDIPVLRGLRKDAPLPPRPPGILRNPSWGPSITSTKRRSSNSPGPAELQKSALSTIQDTTNKDGSPQLSLGPKQISFATNRKSSHASLKDTGPPTPYPQRSTEPSKDAQDTSLLQQTNTTPSARALRESHTSISARSPSVRIVEPSTHTTRSKDAVESVRRTTIAARRRSSIINSAAVSVDTILSLSVRRRYGPNGRRFVRLVVPADQEIATPAQSRKRSTSGGRKVSIASTDPEKSQEGKESENASDNEKAEFDDAAFFRELRKVYYNQLLGSRLWSRFYRRYLSAYVLKRITLVCDEGLEDPDPPNITPATRSTRYLTLSGFNDVESEDSLLRHFLVPNIGRASWRWVRWVHRVAVSVDQDNAEFEAKMRKVSLVPGQRISAVPGGLEFIEGPDVGRLMVAAGIVLIGSVLATVLYIGMGPIGGSGYTVEALTQGEFRVPHRDAADRVVQGMLVGQFVLWFGMAVMGLWVAASSLVT